MIRFACPRCKAILERPENTAGSKFSCPSCGQRLQVPEPPENKTVLGSLVGNDLPAPLPTPPPPLPSGNAQETVDAPTSRPLPPPTFITARQNQAPAPDAPARRPAPPPPPAARARSRRRDEDDYDDDDFPAIERSSRRNRYSREASAKAASSGFVCSLISMGLLLVSFVLWILTAQSQRVRVRGNGDPLFVVIFLVVLGSFVLALLGIVFSSRGLDESNTYNRGQATAGLVCGIIAMVVGSVVGLFFLCVGMFFWSFLG